MKGEISEAGGTRGSKLGPGRGEGRRATGNGQRASCATMGTNGWLLTCPELFFAFEIVVVVHGDYSVEVRQPTITESQAGRRLVGDQCQLESLVADGEDAERVSLRGLSVD